jgi:1,4-dihydroxy-6-naphthoate synthase
MKTLSLGYSPCPNDTFVFYALVHGRVGDGNPEFKERIEDVETLNRLALGSQLDITKLSFGAFAGLGDEYCLMRSGGALGRGCGPLVVAREETGMDALRGKRIAIPGRHTTAFLLLRLYDPALGENAVEMPFHEVMESVRDGRADAGLIIHESRFTYPDYGLVAVADLGQWWEGLTGRPIPLGCIAARRSLGRDTIEKVDGLVRSSVLYAQSYPAEPAGYIRAHSRELEDRVIREHIGLYVNDFTVDIGDAGVSAVEELFRLASERGIVPDSDRPLFY